jgi:hypothetical protein
MLLSNDRETNNETTSAARQQVLNSKYTQPLLSNAFANKHVPTAMNPQAAIEELLETMFSMLSV